MKDEVVLIVGGSGAIGQAAAKLFSKAGAKIVLGARNKEKAELLAQEINGNGGEAYVAQVDVTDSSSVIRMVNDIIKELGKIDVLVNAFGVGLIKPMLDIHPDEAKEVILTNVYGSFLMTQTVVRHMETAKKGRVIMLPGTMGKYVMKNSSVYAATKFALTGFTKALIEESKRSKVYYTLLYLGGVATPFWDNPNVQMKVQKDKMLTPEEVAKAIYYAASQPSGTVLNEVVLQPESHQLI